MQQTDATYMSELFSKIDDEDVKYFALDRYTKDNDDLIKCVELLKENFIIIQYLQT